MALRVEPEPCQKGHDGGCPGPISSYCDPCRRRYFREASRRHYALCEEEKAARKAERARLAAERRAARLAGLGVRAVPVLKVDVDGLPDLSRDQIPPEPVRRTELYHWIRAQSDPLVLLSVRHLLRRGCLKLQTGSATPEAMDLSSASAALLRRADLLRRELGDPDVPPRPRS